MEIVIVGGGVVGLTMANMLAQNINLSIRVLEPKTYKNTIANDYDLRCSAITPMVQEMLVNLGIWQEITKHRIGHYNKMLIWDQEIHNSLEFKASDYNLLNLGYIIENQVLQHELYSLLKTSNNVEIITDSVKDIKQDANNVFLELQNKTILADFLIAADGANSKIRKLLNIPVYKKNYAQIAIVGVVKTQYCHDNSAMQRFIDGDTVAFLPLAEDNLCSIVWSTSIDKANNLLQLSSEEFAKELGLAFDYKLGMLALETEHKGFDLQLQHAQNYVLPKIAFIGDAAHVIHPMAGQGLNLGMLDCLSLSKVFHNNIVHDVDYKLLRKHERERKWHNSSMLLGVDTIGKIFAMRNTTISSARQFTLRMLNNHSLLRSKIVGYATGLVKSVG